jgi:hypothetical protein
MFNYHSGNISITNNNYNCGSSEQDVEYDDYGRNIPLNVNHADSSYIDDVSLPSSMKITKDVVVVAAAASDDHAEESDHIVIDKKRKQLFSSSSNKMNTRQKKKTVRQNNDDLI